MCGLCGIVGTSAHWSDGADLTSSSRRAERQHRIAVANAILEAYDLKVEVWADRFVLRSRTGKSTLVPTLGALWYEAERLSGRRCDPLDDELLAHLEGGQAA